MYWKINQRLSMNRGARWHSISVQPSSSLLDGERCNWTKFITHIRPCGGNKSSSYTLKGDLGDVYGGQLSERIGRGFYKRGGQLGVHFYLTFRGLVSCTDSVIRNVDFG